VRLSLVNSHLQLKSQFDYASLIDHRPSLQLLRSCSSRHSPSLSSSCRQHTSGFATTIHNEEAIGLKHGSLEASLDLQRLLCEKEEREEMISRFKDAKTASVATFGQQGNFNTIGGTLTCTSPTMTTQSPPNQIDGYWRMEERKGWPSQESLGTSKARSTKNSATPTVGKYISAAYERKRQTNRLQKPVLEQKRSTPSCKSLRISTLPAECLSSRSRKLAQLHLENRSFERTFQASLSSKLSQLSPKENQVLYSQRPQGKRLVHRQSQRKESLNTRKNSQMAMARAKAPDAERQKRLSRNAVNMLHSLLAVSKKKPKNMGSRSKGGSV